MRSLDNNTQAFLALVRAGLWETDIQLSSYGDIDFKEVYRLVQEQSVVGLVAAGLEHVVDLIIPKEFSLAFAGEALQLEQRNKAMNDFVAQLIDNLRKKDVYTLLVKGQGIALCYERPLWRACGDVDLFLSDTNYQKALLYLKPLASRVGEEELYKKHIPLSINNWEVELHGTLRSGLWEKFDRVLDDVQNSVFYGGYVRSWMNGATQIFLPRADEDVVFVFTHILQHFYCGGIGLRQICDWIRLQITVEIHPPKTGISVHFPDVFILMALQI